MHLSFSFTLPVALVLALSLSAAPPAPTITPLMQVADLNVGEAHEFELPGGKKATVKLLDLKETRDDLRQAVRKAEVTVDVNGQKVSLVSANYRLPITVAGVQIDCPITKGYCERSSKSNAWGLDKDARIRVWPAGSPWINPGTFLYPAKQRWFASGTQMANEPVHVDGGEIPGTSSIYYHYGLDIGGAEGLVEVVAATDGVVVSSGKDTIPDFKDTPVRPRYDVVYLLDARGWYYRYSHLHTIDPAIKLGAAVKMGQKIGLLGKEGGSGGWSHLHFDVSSRQPSGKWGIVDGYAFLWEAYLNDHKPKLLAVARPHHIASIGEKVTLDGSRSWSSDPRPARHEWTFSDGQSASGSHVERVYAKPGIYSEILKFTDGAGRVDFDFAVVNVLDKAKPKQLPPSIHASYSPTFGIKPGDSVTFLVRTFRTIEGKETWDFGDGSPKVEVRSDGNAVMLAKDGYAKTIHRYEKPGHYLVSVERTNGRGETATARLQVRVGEAESSTRELREKAEAGDASAQFRLGGLYAKGGVVPKDDAEAVKWYRKAAEQGHAGGQSMLGVMYTNARAVPRDYDEAMKWFRKAAAQNSAHAQYNLGYMYAVGKGVEKDSVESANWYRKAAEQNDTGSQRILGSLHATGRGVSKNLIEACAWSRVAADKGDAAARKQLETIEKQMMPGEIAEARKRAEEITAKLKK